MKLSDKLIELRKEKGWSQEDIAERLDVSRQAISRWENGTALPDAQNILRISKLFNISSDFLLNDEYENDAPNLTVDALEEGGAPADNSPKKHSHWYLILAMSLALLAALTVAIVMGIRDNEAPSEMVHSHRDFKVVKENEISSTCSEGGSYDEVIYCTECDEEILRSSKSVEKIAHSLANSVMENVVSSTCIKEGSYEEVTYCTQCGMALTRTYRITEKLAHQYQNKKCVVCGEPQPSEGLVYMSNGDGTCFVSGEACTDEIIIIPEYSPSGETVVGIKAYGFAGNKAKSIRIPETVTAIGEGAFQECKNLESINLPSKLTEIDSYTFYKCEKLKAITIPSGVYSIGTEAFMDCIACESIVIPASVTKIGQFAFCNFSGCDGTVTFEVYKGWMLYDNSGNCVDVIYFEGRVATPTQLITWQYSEYTWKRG